MAQTSYTGIMNSSQFQTDQARKSYAATMMRLMPNGQAPIFGLAANMKTKTALQPQHGYFSKKMVFPSFQTNAAGGYTNADTTFVVDSTSDVLPGQVMQNFRTKEQITVVSITDATHVVVKRGTGTTAAAAILDNDFFPCVGNVNEEGSLRPLEAAVMPDRITNLTQIFRNAWGVTDTMRATLTIVGDGQVSESRQDCMAYHAADIEKALIFGEQYTDVLNNRPRRKMDGIISSIFNAAPGNISTAGATTNYSQLEAMLDPVFAYQSDPKMAAERVLFVGGQARKVINKIGRLSGNYQIFSQETTFGLKFDSFRMSRGEFRLVEHPLLNSNPSWASMAIALDFTSLSLAYLGDRKTKANEYGINGRQPETGKDSVGGDLTTEVTLEMMNPYANGVIYGLTDGAAG